MRKIETTYGEFFNTFSNNPNIEYFVKTNTGEFTKIDAAVEKEDDLVTVTFDSGYSMGVAKGHIFMDESGNQVLVKNLTVGSKVFSTKGVLTVTEIRDIVDDRRCYDIAIKSPHWYVNDSNGVVSHNTMLGLYCLKAYFDKYPDAVCLFYDSEFGATPEYFKSVGVDIDRVIHIPVEHVEQLKFDIVKRLEEISRGDKVFILIDSIGALASKKEVEDAVEEKSVADMSRAKAIRSLLRIVTPHITMKDLPCVIINHVYKSLEMYSKTILPGGCLAYGSKIQMADGSLKCIEDMQVGDLIKTLNGSKKVTAAWNPETLIEGTPECFEIEFEDDFKIVCSDNHPFLTTKGWVKAKDLTGSEDIVVCG